MGDSSVRTSRETEEQELQRRAAARKAILDERKSEKRKIAQTQIHLHQTVRPISHLSKLMFFPGHKSTSKLYQCWSILWSECPSIREYIGSIATRIWSFMSWI